MINQIESIFKEMEDSIAFKIGAKHQIGKKFNRTLDVNGFTGIITYTPVEFVKYNQMLTLKMLTQTTLRNGNTKSITYLSTLI